VADNVAHTISMAGTAVALGGGIAAFRDPQGDGPEVTLLRTSVKGNETRARGTTADAIGGGIICACSTLVLDDTKVTKNLAESRSSSDAESFGGGVHAVETLVVTLTDAVISGNMADAEDADAGAGGLFLDTETTTIAESEITKNTIRAAGNGSTAWGGGIRQIGGTLTVDSGDEDESSEISDNKAIAIGFGSSALGGGYYAESSALAEFNFTEFEGNAVESPEGIARGGGLYIGPDLSDDAILLNQAEVEENEADSGYIQQGGGIYTVCDTFIDYDLSDIEDNEPDNVFEADTCPDA
jgi:hypothetical protein